MKIRFSPAEQKIVDVLRDMNWKCVYRELLMKDDRRRITDIRRKLRERGYDIESKPCTLHGHESRVLMRRIVKLSPQANFEPNKGMSREDYIELGRQQIEEHFGV